MRTNRNDKDQALVGVCGCLLFLLVGAALLLSWGSHSAFADEEEDGEEVALPLLRDVNGDGQVTITAFGDSITRGVGDGIPAGTYVDDHPGHPSGEAGYPLRIEQRMGIPVTNLGDPGEQEVIGGIYRFAAFVPSQVSDIVIIAEGTNDAGRQEDPLAVYRSTQAMINIARALGKTPILSTLAPTSGSHQGQNQWIQTYNAGYRELAVINDIALADVSHAYSNTCNPADCYLLNLPEGVHPNTSGYDVFGEVMMATLLEIPLFAPDGPALLEAALGLPAGSVITVPDATPAVTARTTSADESL